MGELIKIREVSLRYDISARALKYYEDMGLIQSTKSDDYAYRLYDENAIKRLEQILILRKLNIKIKDIQRIFISGGSEVVLEVLSQKVTDIDGEVALLNELKEIVLDFIEQIEHFNFQNDQDVKLLFEKAKDIKQQITNVDYNGNASNVNRLLEVTEKLNKSPDIRVISFPEMKMISSGPIRDIQVFEEFDNWWSSIDMRNFITPRDFLYFDKKENCMIWLIAPPENFQNTSKYKYINFSGGLYAVCSSKDGDGVDMEKTKTAMRKWIEDSVFFEESNEQNDLSIRYELGHVCTPKIFKEKMGYHLMDIFIPIVVKEDCK
jgi:DNA-binding transcriptional MerR regulator